MRLLNIYYNFYYNKGVVREMIHYMYSKKALRAARTSWNTLSNVMDGKPMLFKDDKSFKIFFDELSKKIMVTKDKE